jgi:hypothetical protein
VSWEIANHSRSLGQFASGAGLRDLRKAAASSDYLHLRSFFKAGISEHVEECRAELTRLAANSKIPGVRESALTLAQLVRDQVVMIITDGVK